MRKIKIHCPCGCMLVIFMVIIILTVFLSIKVCGQNLLYCSAYKDKDFVGNLSTVISVKDDSLTSYIYDVGYVSWKIDKSNMTIQDKSILIESGNFYLSNDFGNSYMVIFPKKVIQIINMDSANSLVIEFTIKPMRK